LNGDLDDLCIYDRALSAGEIAQLYKLGTANAAHSNAGISDGLVGYWTFDGPSINWTKNQVADISGNGNTGQLTNMSTTSSPTAGKIGQTLSFNGSTNYVNMGNVLHLTGAFTYSAWIYPTNLNPVGSAPTIMGWYRDVAPGPWFGFNMGNGTQLGLVLFTNASNFISRKYSGAFSPSKWYHAVAAYDGGTTPSAIKVYVNGVRVDDTSGQGGTFTSLPNNSVPLTIGAAADPNYYFAGKIDDVRIYNRALSAAEVQQLSNMGR
jgi:hypothetical protein